MDVVMAPMIGYRAVVAAVIGNALEWYDFILYALFATSIAATFFPAHNPVDSLLLAVATFGAGFVLRPLGALVLGNYADRRGRKSAMTLVILLMTLATALLVFTPGYHTIGLAAPLLIGASRLLQGFSVGGELGSSTALMIEAAPADRRSTYASLQGSSQSVASMAAAAAGVLLTAILSPAQITGGGWRLPFALGLLIGPVGIYVRACLHDPAAIEARLRPEGTPLRTLWRGHRGALLRAVSLICLGTMCTYVLSLNMPNYAREQLGIPASGAYLSSIIGSFMVIVGSVGFGRLADRVGPRPVMLPAAILLGLMVYPCFVLLTRVPTVPVLIAIQAAGLLAASAFSGPVYGLLGELFPPEVRSSGLSIGYNISVLLFGGFAPFFTTWLIKVTQDRHMPGVYVTIGAVISLAGLLVAWPRERRIP